jgi:hypothetical protein
MEILLEVPPFVQEKDTKRRTEELYYLELEGIFTAYILQSVWAVLQS